MLGLGLICKVGTYIETNCLLTSEEPVVVGFSGGCDSVSLLFILKHLGYGCIAAHCNFHLRGDESDRDEEFCRMFANQQDIPFEKVDFDTRAHAARQHVSIEMAARELRYEWFEALRGNKSCQAIAVAHHRDDSNETMLLNMIRGTGIRGLCGIRPRNERIIRPLRCVGKDDIVRFVDEYQLPYMTDSSNLSDAYTRNLVRLHLIPLMKRINPAVSEALDRTSEHLADVENIFLQTIAHVGKSLLEEIDDDVFSISINKLKQQPSPQTILYELLRPFGFTRQLSSDIYSSLSSESGKIFDAPHAGYRLLKDRHSLLVSKKTELTEEMYQIPANHTDFVHLPIRLTMKQASVDSAFEIDKSQSTATFDYEKIKFPLLLRKWRVGDWFVPFGMKGRKKLSDYFTDHKYSLLKKSKTWVLCSGNDILWVVGERADNRFRIEKHTKYALIVKFFPDN